MMIVSDVKLVCVWGGGYFMLRFVFCHAAKI